MNEFSHLTYEDVKHEIYPKGKHLKSWDVSKEFEKSFIPEDKLRMNQQLDYYTINQARLKAEDDYQNYLFKKKNKCI